MPAPHTFSRSRFSSGDRDFMKCIATGLALLCLAWMHGAAAQEQPTYVRSSWVQVRPRAEQPSIFAEDTKVRTLGVSLLVGLPEGVVPMLSVHPFDTNALHVDVGPSGALAFGFRGGVTWDPLDWVLAPTLTVAGGYHFPGEIPGTQNATFSAAYFTVQPGLEIGRRSRFRILLRVGYSRLWVQTHGLENKLSTKYGVTIDAPRITLDLLPTLTLGISAFL
jgi:hypothetical protein